MLLYYISIWHYGGQGDRGHAFEASGSGWRRVAELWEDGGPAAALGGRNHLKRRGDTRMAKQAA
jgi:hypothetical protein